MTKRSIVLAAVFVLAFEAFSETVRTASQPWVTNNVAQAVAPVTAGVATNAAMIAALDHRVDKAALNWVYIPDPSSPWTCTISGKELLLDYVGPIVSSESFSFRWQCSTNSNWWLEYVVYRKWSNSSLVLQADGNFWECDGVWRHRAGEEHPRCYESCDANSLSFKTPIGTAITMTRDVTDLYAEPALLRNAYLNDIWEVEADVATNAAEIATLSQSIDYSTNNTALVDTIETVAPQPGDYATVSNLAVHAVQTETDPTVPSWAKASSKPGYSYSEISGTPDLGGYATTGAVAQVSSTLAVHASDTNNPHHVTAAQIGALTSETDPTVPSWAKASSKPGYSYSEISNTPDLSGYATTGALDNYLPLSGGVVTGNVFVAQQTGDTNDILVAVGEQTYGRFSIPAGGTYPDRSIDYEDERTIAALLKEGDMPLLRLEKIEHGRVRKGLNNLHTNLVSIAYEKAELDMDGLGHVRIDTNGVIIACDIHWPTPPEGTNYICGTMALREEIPEVPTEWDYTAITNAPWLTSYTETDPTVPTWAKASNKPGYTLNEICPDEENWLGVQGNAGRCIKVLAGTVGGNIVGGMRVTASSLNDNNMTTYTYGGVAVRRNGTNQDYLWDGSSTNGIVRRGELATVATSGSYNDLSNAPDLGGYATTAKVAQVARDLSAVSNVAASAVLTETDPTVPSWAKASNKPSYSYSEISNTPDLGGYATTAALDSGTNTVAGLGARIFYGTCATGASTAAKVVTCAGFKASDLKAGTVLWVKFSAAQTYNGAPTINVNSTGAVNIKRAGTTNAARYEWVAGEMLCFVHDGSYWVLTDGGLATTSYYGATKLSTTATSTGTTLALTPASLNSFSQGMIAPYPVYAKTGIYEPGDRVRYSYNTYVCKASVVSQDWDAASWEMMAPIQTQLDDLKPSGPIATNSVVRATSGDACRVSLASGATLSAALDVEGVPVMGIVEPAGAYSVSPSIHLLGYGAWPTNSFQAVFWRVGQTTYVNVLSDL